MKRLLALVIPFLLVQTSKADTPRDTVDALLSKPVQKTYYHGGIYERRLDSIQKEVPLVYNEYVQSYIDLYLSQRDDISRIAGLTKYYFPIYEKAFQEAGIPDELKYLSIVESKLDPYAVSRVGATGPWQFMSNTAHTYGLVMDDYVDERRDPIQSSAAAAAYLKDAYEQFGDWLLAIASYNCGKSEVMQAIDKAGSNDFWAIREYLPAETRGYVPAYIAMTYVMNYYKRYHIMPQPCSMALKTDTVSVDKVVSLYSVSKVLKISLSQLTALNPSYKRLIVNGSAASPKRLVIPQSSKDKYTALYNMLNSDISYNELMPGIDDSPQQAIERETIPVHHRIRKFETLASLLSYVKINKG